MSRFITTLSKLWVLFLLHHLQYLRLDASRRPSVINLPEPSLVFANLSKLKSKHPYTMNGTSDQENESGYKPDYVVEEPRDKQEQSRSQQNADQEKQDSMRQ
jgi:hypothetical protein